MGSWLEYLPAVAGLFQGAAPNPYHSEWADYVPRLLAEVNAGIDWEGTPARQEMQTTVGPGPLKARTTRMVTVPGTGGIEERFLGPGGRERFLGTNLLSEATFLGPRLLSLEDYRRQALGDTRSTMGRRGLIGSGISAGENARIESAYHQERAGARREFAEQRTQAERDLMTLIIGLAEAEKTRKMQQAQVYGSMANVGGGAPDMRGQEMGTALYQLLQAMKSPGAAKPSPTTTTPTNTYGLNYNMSPYGNTNLQNMTGPRLQTPQLNFIPQVSQIPSVPTATLPLANWNRRPTILDRYGRR